MANIAKIELPSGDVYDLKDSNALPLTGGIVTGVVTFQDSVSIADLAAGDLVVNGNASFTNNIQANTINNVAVGNSPKFTDTVTTVTTTGSGNAVTAITATNGALTITKGSTFLTSYTETDPVFTASAAHGISSTDITNWNSKQAALVSGTNIKTLNGTSLLGSGNIALTIPSITLNGSSTTSPSFYAPTTAGTNGYVLKSNGSGAPTWMSAELTDEKVKVEATTGGEAVYYPIITDAVFTTSTQLRTDSLSYELYTNYATLHIGKSNQQGRLGLYAYGTAYQAEIYPSVLSASRNFALPDASGTIALTSDITTAVLSATDDGNGNVTLSVTGVTSANLNSASGVSF